MAFSNSSGPSDHFTNINNLNNVSSNPYESAGVSDNDLALFTNSEFFDWDATDGLDSKLDPLSAQASDGGFVNGNFNFDDIPILPGDSLTTNPKFAQPQQPLWDSNSQATQSTGSPASQTSQPVRRRNDTSKQPESSESPQADTLQSDALQVSAEEDKRRRNTAASARFRIKKKQREQAIEKTAKEMTDRVQSLENKITELEKENKLLKGLLTEKSTSKTETERSRKRLKREEEV